MNIEIVIKDSTYKISKHALYRAEKRNVSIDDVIETLENPKRKYRCNKSKKQDRILVQGKNDIIIVLSICEKFIITIYNRSKTYYNCKKKKEYNKIRRKLKQQYGNRIKH